LALAVVRGSEKWVSCSCQSFKLWEWVSCSLWFTSSSFSMIHNSTWYVSWNSGYRFCRPICLPRFWADYYILTYCWELMKSLLFVNEGDRSETFWVTLISLWPHSLSSYLQIVVAEISLQFHRYDKKMSNASSVVVNCFCLGYTLQDFQWMREGACDSLREPLLR
jgi:hypothetical protein